MSAQEADILPRTVSLAEDPDLPERLQANLGDRTRTLRLDRQRRPQIRSVVAIL